MEVGNLTGICYHKLKTERPRHPVLGPPTPVKARLKVVGFVDDIKGVLRTREEFKILDDTICFFELWVPVTQGPHHQKVLTLGSWEMQLLEARKLTARLHVGGARAQHPRGEDAKIVKHIPEHQRGGPRPGPESERHHCWVQGWQVPPPRLQTLLGQHLHLVETDLQILDLQPAATGHQQDAICHETVGDARNVAKTPELLLQRNPEEGGLGLVQAGARCKPNLIKCFVDQGHPGSRFSNIYLNSLFRCYVTLEMSQDLIKRPPFFAGDFFPIITETWHAYDGHILGITTRQWQNIILERGITHVWPFPKPEIPSVLPCQRHIPPSSLKKH